MRVRMVTIFYLINRPVKRVSHLFLQEAMGWGCFNKEALTKFTLDPLVVYKAG